MIQKIRLLFLLSGLLLLAGCSQEYDLALYKDEYWVFESAFTYNPDEIPEIGLSMPVVEGLSIGAGSSLLNPGMVDLFFDQAIDVYQQYGFDASWEKDEFRNGDIAYTLRVEGVGWNRLSDLVDGVGSNEFDLPAAVVSVSELDNGDLHFTADYPEDPFGGLGALFFQTTFRLRGSRIISSNADEVRGGTAIWKNPSGRLEATLTPASQVNWTIVLAVVASVIVLVLVVGGYLLLQQGGRKRRPSDRRKPERERAPRPLRKNKKRKQLW